jgi:hypothetical protein
MTNKPSGIIEKRKRRQAERKARIKRVYELQEKRELVRNIMLSHESRGDMKAARHCATRIRTIDQQIKYIGIIDFPLEQ